MSDTFHGLTLLFLSVDSAMLPEGFVPAPRITSADESGDRSTHNRKLHDRVYYFLDQSTFPTSLVQDGESLLEAARRTIGEQGGENLDIYYPSQAPMGVLLKSREELKTTAESIDDDRYFGTKTFFLRVQLDEGDVNTKKLQGRQAEWLDRTEIVQHMADNAGKDESKFYHYLL